MDNTETCLHCITNFLIFVLGKISKICDPTVSLVFTCSDPPLVMTYDFVIGLHSVWHVTKARAEVHVTMYNYIEIIHNVD